MKRMDAERHTCWTDRALTALFLLVIVAGLALLVMAAEQGWVWT